MDAVLPWQSLSLDRCYQEPNSSFGGHALTVSLWKQMLAPNRIVGRGPMGAPGVSSTRVSSGSKKSIAGCKEHVNMVCLQYAESQNHPFNGARQTSHCRYQGLLRTNLGQRGNTVCFEQGMERGSTGHSTSLQIKNAPFLPRHKWAGLPGAVLVKLCGSTKPRSSGLISESWIISRVSPLR